MFIRKKRNKSGSVSIQILTKIGRKNELLKAVGCAKTYREEELLVMLANTEMERLSGASFLFTEPDDLVVENFEYGYPIGYEIFEGNTSETKTLIPVLESFQEKFKIGKPIIVADAALLSQKNINALLSNKYEYIPGGRIKNETNEVKTKIAVLKIEQGKPVELKTNKGRLVVSYSHKRAHNDKKNRQKGLKRLEKKVQSGKLSKEHINNRGYNKYLKITGEANISIDYDKYEADAKWDGLKGFVTNTKLARDKVIENYSQLWQVEKAFRISKTDLRIRPVYHRLKNRIEAHICICFAAYTLYQELERLLRQYKIGISAEKAIEEIKEIRQLKICSA